MGMKVELSLSGSHELHVAQHRPITTLTGKENKCYTIKNMWTASSRFFTNIYDLSPLIKDLGGHQVDTPDYPDVNMIINPGHPIYGDYPSCSGSTACKLVNGTVSICHSIFLRLSMMVIPRMVASGSGGSEGGGVRVGMGVCRWPGESDGAVRSVADVINSNGLWD